VHWRHGSPLQIGVAATATAPQGSCRRDKSDSILTGEADRVLFLDGLGMYDFFTELRPLEEKKVDLVQKHFSLICVITIFKRCNLPLGAASFRKFHIS
jgi:hypothetical protein